MCFTSNFHPQKPPRWKRAPSVMWITFPHPHPTPPWEWVAGRMGGQKVSHPQGGGVRQSSPLFSLRLLQIFLFFFAESMGREGRVWVGGEEWRTAEFNHILTSGPTVCNYTHYAGGQHYLLLRRSFSAGKRGKMKGEGGKGGKWKEKHINRALFRAFGTI